MSLTDADARLKAVKGVLERLKVPIPPGIGAGYGLYWRILILIAYVSPIYGMFSARSTRAAFKASTVLTVWKGGYLSSDTYIGIPHSYLID